MRVREWALIVVLAVIALLLGLWGRDMQAQEAGPLPLLLSGSVYDNQAQPVAGAEVTLYAPPADDALATTVTQSNGLFALLPAETLPPSLAIHVERPHFVATDVELSPAAVAALRAHQSVVVRDITLSRQIDPSFWLATLIFVGMLVIIATGVLHNTLAALLGASLLLALSYLGPLLGDGLFIFDFMGALDYIDWNVIFLIMGMMIVIAVVERTGIFQWMAYQAYRLSHGKLWLLLPILMVVTGVASAFLDNVTTMLLMTPITIQIAIALGISPLALLLPEVMASNVVGISTLIGTPTNILIGSYANITFNDFLVNLTPGVLLALAGLILYNEFIYRRQLRTPEGEGISDMLLAKLAERGRITQRDHLKKAGVVGAGMLVLFVVGEHIHLLPAVTALIGATALLVWIRPDVEEMIEAVDWTTLVFFMSLFMVVGGIQEVGLISALADVISRLVGDNLLFAILVVTWLSALASTVVANIPFTAAMLPIVGYLTVTIPGAQSKVLFYCLSVGSAMGGNGSLIGASANMVTAGISERAGQPITYVYFFKKGFPALVLTVALASLWLLIHFAL